MSAGLSIVLMILACHTTESAPDYAVPAGVPVSLSDPGAGADTWPDDGHTRADTTTPTGRRLHLRAGARTELQALLPPDFDLLDALEQLDGFGVNASIFLRFSHPIDPATLPAAVHFLALPSGEAIPWEHELTDDGTTVLFTALAPLRERTRYAVLVDDDLRTSDGEPVWPAPRVHALARGDTLTPQDAWAAPAWTAAVALAELHPDEVVAGTTFLTQTLYAQDEAAAALLATHPPVVTHLGCAPEGDMRRCDLQIEVADVLGPDETLGADELPAVQRRYTLELPVWLPTQGSGPWPVVLHGHGLGGDRFESRNAARKLTPIGVAVTGVDAPRHGDHPTATATGGLIAILDFFGIDLFQGSLHAGRLRDHFRQSAWDRLQVVAALHGGLDVDDDGVIDLDGTVWWTGHSLGGVIGPHLLGLTPHVGGAFLSVPGGRVASIVHRSQTFAPLVALMAPPGTSRGAIDRFFPLLQTAIDRGDPSSWAPRVLDGTRDLAVTQVIHDTIIPNETTRHLARSLGVPHAGPVLQEVVGLPRYSGTAPVNGNVDDRSAALWQYQDAHFGGVPATVDHSDVWDSDEHTAQLQAFFQALKDSGRAIVIDPGAAHVGP